MHTNWCTVELSMENQWEIFLAPRFSVFIRDRYIWSLAWKFNFGLYGHLRAVRRKYLIKLIIMGIFLHCSVHTKNERRWKRIWIVFFFDHPFFLYIQDCSLMLCFKIQSRLCWNEFLFFQILGGQPSLNTQSCIRRPLCSAIQIWEFEY